MATQHSDPVNITNNSGGNAWILLYHSNSSNGTQQGSWLAAPGQTVGPLTVHFETGIGTYGILDYWCVMIHVKDGPSPGLYISSGSVTDKYWKECQLQHGDVGKTITLSVSTTKFDVNLPSGGCSDGMTKLAPGASPISHVFVVMLENHSFDNVFAMSGIPQITAATTSDSNSYNGTTYNVQTSAPLSLPTDPGHEFPDVVEQLGGQGASWTPGGPYPPISNSGFAANYATSTSEGTGLPPAQDIVDVMACFATSSQLTVMYQLATLFAVCDHWHSSLPGPTWPNRFFVHGASSSGLDDSPSSSQIKKWELPLDGFKYANGSIYDALGNAGIQARFYNDTTSEPLGHSLYSDDSSNGSIVGAVSQVTSLKGVTIADMNSLSHFAADLQGPYPFPYTFIEPHYGDVTGGTYRGGSSQHPMDDVYGGEHLLASVYSAIRNSPYWNTSLLIVTYDEHGGLYDSVPPPTTATPPGDKPDPSYSQHGFPFNVYGVRVPAVVVSPLIPGGTVDHTLYDHSSVPKTLEHLFGLKPLTARDAAANDVVHLMSLSSPRTDCPTSLNPPAPLLKAAAMPLTDVERAQRDAQPLPESGNLIGALQNLRKAEADMSGRTPPEIAAILGRYNAIQTRGDARDYAASVMAKAAVIKQQQRIANRGRI